MPSSYAGLIDASVDNNSHSFLIDMIGMNQRVLELGAADGDVTKVLVDRGCRVVAVERDPDAIETLRTHECTVVEGDLNDAQTLETLDGPFDVVCAGDVLQHLTDPQGVLNRAVRLLAPGGRLVASVPNIAHVDVRLALMQGRFDYSDTGLLDQSHLHHFTLKRIEGLAARAGLAILDMRRVIVPPFQTDIELSRADVAGDLLAELQAAPEAETYQFVFLAVPHDGDHQTTLLASRISELQAEVARLQAFERPRMATPDDPAILAAHGALVSREHLLGLEGTVAELRAALAAAQSRNQRLRTGLTDARQRVKRLNTRLNAARAEITAIRRSRTWRIGRLFTQPFGALRSRMR